MGFFPPNGYFPQMFFFRENKLIYKTKTLIRINYCKKGVFVGEGRKHEPFDLQNVHAYSCERQAQTVLIQLHITHMF